MARLLQVSTEVYSGAFKVLRFLLTTIRQARKECDIQNCTRLCINSGKIKHEEQVEVVEKNSQHTVESLYLFTDK